MNLFGNAFQVDVLVFKTEAAPTGAFVFVF